MVRHPTHDYSSEGTYFVTICAHQRHLVFEEEPVRQAIQWAWDQIPDHFAQVETDAFVVMPNHVHGILRFHHVDRHAIVGAQHAGRLLSRTHGPKTAALGVVIRAFKAATTRELRARELWNDQPFWQRNYYDHVIRDEVELHRIREYIAYNPIAWRYDHENPDRLADADHVKQWAWLENLSPNAR